MAGDVRTIEQSDLPAWCRQMGIGFLRQELDAWGDYMGGVVDLERTWAAFDGGTVVGTLRSAGTPLTVPGPAEVRAAGLTNVTVAPTHRRRGLLTKMISADLRRSADLGEPVGILIASEYPIYGRFGYGPAVEGATWTVSTPDIRFLEPPTGTVELLTREAMRKLGPPVYERFRTARTGSIERNDDWWDRSLRQIELPADEPDRSFWALYRSPEGEPEGFVRYTAKPDWEGMRPRGTLEIHDLISTTPDAYRALWAYCAGVDLLVTIEAQTRPVDEVLPLLVRDGRLVSQTRRFDFVWVRVLDAVAALTGRCYPAEGRLVMEVLDPDGFAGGRFALEGGPTGATCAPTTESPQLTLPVQSLGSVYLGGVAPSRLLDAGLIDEHESGAAARADLMFCTARQPWCATWF